MSTDLESALRSAAKSGRLNYISLAFVKDKWEVVYRGVDSKDGRFCSHTDVVSAMISGLTGRKIAEPERSKPAARVRKPVQDENEDIL